MSESTPFKEKKEKKEKKDKKRKSEAADVTMDTETPIKPEVVPPAEGTASADAVAMEVDGEKAAKKAKKEKRKSVGGDVAAEEQDAKVSFWFMRLKIWDQVCESALRLRTHARYLVPCFRLEQHRITILTHSPSSLSP